MAVPADQDMGVGPAMTQVRQETGQNHGILRACGACPGPEVRCDQRMRRALKDKKRQIAIALVVMVIEGEFLLAMRGVIGVIEVKHDGSGGLCVASNKVVYQGRGETIEVLAVQLVLKTRERRSTGQVLRGLQRQPIHPQLKHGVMPEAIGIVTIGIARGDMVDTLREELPEGMVNVRRMPLLMDGRCKAFGETNLAIDPAQQERAKVRR